MAKGQGKAPSQRQLRVGEELRHVLAAALERGEVHDPVLSARAVTVTEVRVSPDLRNATVFVMPLGGGGEDEVLRALKRARPFLRHVVAQHVHLRYVPDLRFESDTSFDAAQRIERLLQRPEVRRDVETPDDDGAEGASDRDG